MVCQHTEELEMTARLARRRSPRRPSRSRRRDPWRRALVLEALEDRILLSAGLLPGPDPDEEAPAASSEAPIEPAGSTAQIQGTVWDDLNGDGVRDAGEPGQNGQTVFIDQDT